MVTFNTPAALLLLLSVPVIWISARRSYAQGGDRRNRYLVCLLRTVGVILLVLALSDPRPRTRTDRVNLFFCVDESDSIAAEQKQATAAFIQRTHRLMQKEDAAGLIRFGRHPLMEVPMKADFRLPDPSSDVDSRMTDIYGALQLALGRFSESGSRKIVLLTDGNENIQESLEMAALAGSLGIPIFPVPLVSWFGKQEVFVEKLITPPVVPLDTPFEIRLLVGSSTETRGQLVLFKNNSLLIHRSVDLRKGSTLFTVADVIAEPGLHRYRAVINPGEDTVYRNNEGLSYTRGTQRSRILYLSDGQDPDAPLLRVLALQGLTPVRKTAGDLTGSVQELAEYEAIILDNLSARSMTAASLEAIERYVRDMGGGLIMVGGDRSFGAGHYHQTPVERALPVFMDIPTELQLSRLCLVFVIDKSASMSASYSGKTKLEMAKVATFSAIEMLNPTDRIGILAFDAAYQWIVPVTPAGERQTIADRLSRITEGGGTILFPALEDAFRVLKETPASRKHVIVLSDGETDPGNFESLVRAMHRADISVSTVCIGKESDIQLMTSIARWGNGRSYYTDDPATIPKIFTGETRIVARNLLIENTLQPVQRHPNEITQGIEGPLPPVYGQVLTYPKPGAAVYIETSEGPLLAAWRYGLGRSAAFTADLSGRWGKAWTQWHHYGRFVAQLVKWAQRKGSPGHYRPTVRRIGETGTLFVDVTAGNRFQNHLNLRLNVLSPLKKDHYLPLELIAPGRYAAAFPAEEIGDYYLTVVKEEAGEPIHLQVLGYGIPYSDEFLTTDVNRELLERLASVSRGRVLSLDDPPADLFTADSGAQAPGIPLWPYLVFAAALLLTVDAAARKWLDIGLF